MVIIAGSPPGIPGSTNALRIHRMGDAINGSRRPTADPSDPHDLRPTSWSSRATPARVETEMVFQLDCRHATSTRSSARQHHSRISAELLTNCQRG